jgi:hypothetical protein
MATPPYNFDTSNPAATADPSAFPTNEQAFRGTVQSAFEDVMDPTTGFGPILQILTTTQQNALVNPPTGMLIYNTTIPSLTINTGTPGSPTWTSAA